MNVAVPQKLWRGLSAKLSDGQFTYLRRASCEAGVSMSEYLRLLVARDAEEKKQFESFMSTVRKGKP